MATVKLACRQWSASFHNRPDQAAGAALKLRAPSHSCYVIRCVQPGRILGLAGPHLRPTGRPGRVLGQTRTKFGYRSLVRSTHTSTASFRIAISELCLRPIRTWARPEGSLVRKVTEPY